AEDGLCGNDDAGQMSAWYIFSALGFYPVTPGSDEYAIGSPLVKSAQFELPNGKTLKLTAENQSPINIYVQDVIFNGKIVDGYQLKHSDLIQGGELIFKMNNKPKT
ncbi:MAG: glycoside hydrolase domain-containing protein, partial [Crocinitomicaceae bacterium]